MLNLKEVRVKLHDGAPRRRRASRCAGRRRRHGGRHPGRPARRDPEPRASTSRRSRRTPTSTSSWSIRLGRGYVPAERNKREGDPVGTIPIDAIFSPVRKVNYNVTNARVGQRTDYDRLVLEVWTDGSVRPEDAVAYAARILQEQLAIFVNFEEEPRSPATARAAARCR